MPTKTIVDRPFVRRPSVRAFVRPSVSIVLQRLQHATTLAMNTRVRTQCSRKRRQRHARTHTPALARSPPKPASKAKRAVPPPPSQTTEQMEALTLDDDTPMLERLSLLLEKGQPIQRLSAVENLPGAVRMRGASACEPLLKLLSRCAPRDVRQSCAATF